MIFGDAGGHPGGFCALSVNTSSPRHCNFDFGAARGILSLKNACEHPTRCLHTERDCSPNKRTHERYVRSDHALVPQRHLMYYRVEHIKRDRGRDRRTDKTPAAAAASLSSPFPRYHLRRRVARRSASGLQHLSTLTNKRGKKKGQMRRLRGYREKQAC